MNCTSCAPVSHLPSAPRPALQTSGGGPTEWNVNGEHVSNGSLWGRIKNWLLDHTAGKALSSIMTGSLFQDMRAQAAADDAAEGARQLAA
ncbi:MAG: hypothetical protein JWM98_176 [Thermoleophilia bacterium]|nr:hypothetical protein [Thermoleophilia bacterium]